jgi:hypothetical protein
MPKRATSTSFGRGQSGNPAGRPKSTLTTQRLRDEARAHGIAAVKVFVSAMNDIEAKLADRLKAAQVVLEYGFGKPGSMEQEQPGTVSGAELVELFRRPPPSLCPAESRDTEHEPVPEDAQAPREACG